MRRWYRHLVLQDASLAQTRRKSAEASFVLVSQRLLAKYLYWKERDARDAHLLPLFTLHIPKIVKSLEDGKQCDGGFVAFLSSYRALLRRRRWQTLVEYELQTHYSGATRSGIHRNLLGQCDF